MSAFEADRFNHSRTSPKNSCRLSALSYQLAVKPKRGDGQITVVS